MIDNLDRALPEMRGRHWTLPCSKAGSKVKLMASSKMEPAEDVFHQHFQRMFRKNFPQSSYKYNLYGILLMSLCKFYKIVLIAGPPPRIDSEILSLAFQCSLTLFLQALSGKNPYR